MMAMNMMVNGDADSDRRLSLLFGEEPTRIASLSDWEELQGHSSVDCTAAGGGARFKSSNSVRGRRRAAAAFPPPPATAHLGVGQANHTPEAGASFFWFFNFFVYKKLIK